MRKKIKNFIKEKKILFILIGIFLVLIISLVLIFSYNKSPEFIYGVGIHSGHYTGVNTMAELGVSMVRDDFSWGGIEKIKGVYNFSAYDLRVSKLEEKNITILAILAYGNSLYLNIPQDVRDYNANPSNRWKHNWMTNDPEEFKILKKAYGDYVYQTVLHYKGKIKYFEIWNEPYVQTFWYPNVNPVLFTELLKEAYTKAKEANPEVVILNSGVTSLDFMQTMYIYGAKDYYDIQSFHPYCPPNDPLNYSSCSGMNNIFKLRKMMKEYGDNSPIWITEMGYPSTACSQTGENCGEKNSLEGQAIYLNHTLQAVKKDMPYVQAFFWYDFRNDCSDSWSECNFGLTYMNYSKKPAFYEYQRIINESKN
jgi:hypothetical protein